MTPEQMRRVADLLRLDAKYLQEVQIRSARDAIEKWTAEHTELITLARELEDHANEHESVD